MKPMNSIIFTDSLVEIDIFKEMEEIGELKIHYLSSGDNNNEFKKFIYNNPFHEKDHIFIFSNKKVSWRFDDIFENYTLISDNLYTHLVRLFSYIVDVNNHKDFYYFILENIHHGIQVIDDQGIVKYVNPAFTRITNIPPNERMNKHIKNFSPEGALYKSYLAQKPVIQLRSSGAGSKVETISSAHPIVHKEKFLGAVATLQDISEIKYLTHKILSEDNAIFLTEETKNLGFQANYTFDHLIGKSPQIKEVIDLCKRVARTNSTVLITGESGTGKELFAHAIHNESIIRKGPFVIVNCAAIPETLLEGELFGYEKGAFTSAINKKIGKVELANNGTLFLDEIGEMSLPLQAKLLRFLQSREIERIGGMSKINVNLRIIAATNRNLKEMVNKGLFREDLYYRLHVINIEIPPLRNRKSDIVYIVDNLMDKISKRARLPKMQLSNKCYALLSEYDWPGNVRELENFLERIMNETTSSVISYKLIEKNINKIIVNNHQRENTPYNTDDNLPLSIIEKSHIARVLKKYDTKLEGKKEAAKVLGISLATLYNKIKKYNIE